LETPVAPRQSAHPPGPTGTTPGPVAWIVDDDPDLGHALAMLLATERLAARVYDDPRRFVAEFDDSVGGAILLDVRMPQLNGFEVQALLGDRRIVTPIVFLSGHGDIPMAVRALQGGAMDFLEKPVETETLFVRLRAAFALDAQRREGRVRRRGRGDVSRVGELTPREREVATLACDGLRNKDIARKLRLSVRTVEMHRTRVLRRLGARTFAEVAAMLSVAGG
jgi:FixJ family two-component response regulator